MINLFHAQRQVWGRFFNPLNGEDLIYDKKKLYFPSKELSDKGKCY